MKRSAFLLYVCALIPAFAAPTFHKDVEPILQKNCQSCHRPGEIGPMSFMSYEEARPWAKAIRTAVIQKKMPPWFAEPGHATYSNDRSLSKADIDILTLWVDSGALEGNPKDAPAAAKFVDGWRIGKPELVVQIPKPYNVPASGTIPYQYISIPSGFTEDKWVQAVEVRPTNRRVVHHIIASTSPGNGTVPAAEFRTAPDRSGQIAARTGKEPPQFAASLEGETLQVYVPGGNPPSLAPGQAKLVKAGSNINFQLHYTPSGKPEIDQTQVGFIFAKEPPKQRIKGVLAYNTHFTIPAGANNQLLTARTEVLSDMRMVSMLPHMHLRGKDFQYRAIYPSGESEVLLNVPHYDFNWQINYYLAEPKLLPKGTIIEVTGHYDNSANNKYNPDAEHDVHYGEQTWEEMLNGFMEVAITPGETPPLLGPAPEAKSSQAVPASDFLAKTPEPVAKPAAFTFNRDVLPILQQRCQSCHRPGEPAPMPLLTYTQTRPWAKAIRTAVVEKRMPPWFADASHGTFSNDRRLSAHEIQVLSAWADSGAPEGDPKDAPKPLEFADGWSIGKPDLIIETQVFTAPASGSIPYQYIMVPTGLTEDRWIEAAEVRPGNRSIVHHVIASSLDPKKNMMARGKTNAWMDAEAIAKATARKPGAPEPNQFASGTDSDVVSVFVPGFNPPVFEPNKARLLKAGSVVFFQIHYTTAGKPESDVTRVGIRFAKNPPQQRVKTVNVQNFAFSIPPNVNDYRIEARARLTRDITLLSLLPHMHLRGKTFEYRAIYPSGESEVLLQIPKWDFNWQISYLLKEPKRLPKGTILEVVATFDNTRNNPFNPDANAEVLYGEQTWNEMMGGLMDIALSPETGDPELFEPVKKAAVTASVAIVKP